MKQKLLVFTFSAACALGMLACQQDTQPTSGGRVLPLKSSPPPANPALTYAGTVTSHHNTYSAIYVMDTDTKNNTAIQVAGSTTSTIGYGASPSWSSKGTSSIAFLQYGVSTEPDSIKAIDVSVNSNGVPVGSNVRTIVAEPNQNVQLRNPFWSSTTSMGMIAYAATSSSMNTVNVVSQSGGTPTVVRSATTSEGGFGYSTWSPDDSRLAVLRTGSTTDMIMIFNTSDWSYVDSIAVPATVYGLEWSRTGLNKLAYGFQPGTTLIYLYYCDPTTGATPTTDSVLIAQNPEWSPNNSSILCEYNSLEKIKPFTTSITTVSSTNFGEVKWKR